MISVAEALSHLFALARPLGTETVPLDKASGRILREPVIATRAQPPFAASAMDGYAVRGTEAKPGARFRIAGEAPAGMAFTGEVGEGEAVRIFTGAPMPEGLDHVIIQEDVTAGDGWIDVLPTLGSGHNVRPAGGDFVPGDRITAPRRLRPSDVALAASMNVPQLTVTRRPEVALIATGDELVMPGDTPRPDQIIASNAFGLKAMFEAEGARTRLLPIAKDTEASLTASFERARGSDLIVTIGGASVGDYDLVAPVAEALGMQRSFYKIAMRPGKPLMAGSAFGATLVGLPGNPVSAMVCGHIFVLPLIRAMLGLPAMAVPRQTAPLGMDIDANGPREHYMRAILENGTIRPFDRQDSSLLSILSNANALIVRPPHDGPRETGERVEFLPI